jgi:predicted O-linked N-acetylglucosamine transferase (SPINDLY family)
VPSLDELYRAAIRAHQTGHTKDAARLYDDILARKPDHAGALHLKGVLALQAGDYDTAVNLIERSLKIEPRHGLALMNLGVAYRALKRYEEAIAVLRKAVALEPNSADAWGNLGQTLARSGQIREAVASNTRALDLDPSKLGLQSSLLFAQNYLAESDPFEAADRARAVGKLIAQKVPARTTHPNDTNPDRKLRLGLLSADLRAHPIGRFLSAVLREIDPSKIELFAYSNSEEDDAVTADIRASIPHWLNVHGMSDRDLDARIVADRIDILGDISGHTGGNRLMVCARKPAPVSFTWLGYFATTGLTAIDYVLANKWVIPEAEEPQWSETPWRLPDTYLCYAVPRDALPPTPLPAIASGHITFGCFNNFNKLTDATLSAWSALLTAVPNSRLILRSSGLYHDEILAGLRKSLTTAGIDLARVRIDGKIADYAAHLRSYGEIDIALDPFPYNGGTTTVEALYMGVPVLVRTGDRYVAHMGESILHNAGLPEWIATDETDYAVRGTRLASDFDALAALREGLRPRMLASPLFDAPRFARNLEGAFRGMWATWCAAQRRA